MVFTLFGYWARRGTPPPPPNFPERNHHLTHPRVTARGGGSPKGLVHDLLMQFFTPDSSKIEIFETYFFFDIVIT